VCIYHQAERNSEGGNIRVHCAVNFGTTFGKRVPLRPDTYGNPRTVTCSAAAIARPQKSTACDVASGTASGAAGPHAMLKKCMYMHGCRVCSFDLRASSTCCRAKARAGFRETIFKEGTYRDTKIADRGRDDGVIYIDYYLKEVHPLFFYTPAPSRVTEET